MQTDKDGKQEDESDQDASEWKLEAQSTYDISVGAESEEIVVEVCEADAEMGGKAGSVHGEAEDVGHLHEIQSPEVLAEEEHDGHY